MKKAMDKLDLLVVVDPFPSATAAMAAMPGKPEDLNPKRAVYLLPACTQFETSARAPRPTARCSGARR